MPGAPNWISRFRPRIVAVGFVCFRISKLPTNRTVGLGRTVIVILERHGMVLTAERSYVIQYAFSPEQPLGYPQWLSPDDDRARVRLRDYRARRLRWSPARVGGFRGTCDGIPRAAVHKGADRLANRRSRARASVAIYRFRVHPASASHPRRRVAAVRDRGC